MYKKQNLICSPSGEILLTIKEDHQDLCDDLQELRDTTEGWTPERTMKMTMSIPTQEYHFWADKMGTYDCWEDDDFLKYWNVVTKGRYQL